MIPVKVFQKPVRDPQRVVKALLEYLALNPDLRVAQVISNARYRAGGINDVYYFEDESLAEELEKMVKGI